MLSKIILGVFLFSVSAQAGSKLSAACEKQIVDVVYDKLGRYDETFSVFGYKVIYDSGFTQLAVVRTSDEVEPRDVLVSVSGNNSKCVVKYKDVLADGITADLDKELVELTQQPEQIPSKHFEITGTITNVLTGEIDPFVIGDACLIEVKMENAPNIVFNTSQWDCDDNSAPIKTGQKVTVTVHKKDRIKNKKELAVLKEVFQAPRYYLVPFNEIKLVK